MIALLLTLWLWSPPTCGESPTHYRVESARIWQVAAVPGMDDAGNLVWLPIYALPAWTLIQESAAMQADDPCAPLPGDVCLLRVTGLDDAGNEDAGPCE